ncbi:hypothetical protein DPMN_140937 [Dreissena polymorpha]|uniref:Uncharacterized protein n=1 Tax=Dreissena polymorpha TaxID=45954 RepID=A0A9D4G914_DREPO|nr:hypothetical protein DPMN_140937 [Dreissena polymorpha]
MCFNFIIETGIQENTQVLIVVAKHRLSNTRYLPTPITMLGARRIEVGNHSCLTLAAHEPAISEQVP